ncbi:MAG: DnaD domain protein, partial [Clostridia bacterium]|nr:DnaD domain protein [Clostridia bacterium]
VSIELADKKISELEEKKEAWRKIQKLLGLEYRKPSSKEEVIYTDWVVKWKFSDDMIKYAYDKCIEAIGKYQLKYMNSILQRWYTGGIKTLEQAKKDTEQYAQKAKKTVKGGASDTGGLSQSGSSNSSFDMDDLQGLSMFSD